MNPLDLLETPLRKLLEFLHEHGNLTYGWSIVVLTMIVRSALLPLVIKQYRSMRQMQIYAPQLKELQRKYKGDRPKQQEELMKFYRENQINPFASCLPLVAQFPIFIALYYVLRAFSKTAGQDGSDLSFMWVIPDITRKLTEIGSGAFVIVAIYGISQLLSSELSHTVGMPESQRRMMRVIPVVVVIFVFQFPVPSGLVLYWMTTNLWTAGQQLVMRHKIGLHLAEHPEEAATKRSSRTTNGASTDGSEVAPRKPGLMSRLLTPPTPPTNGTPAIADASDDAVEPVSDESDDVDGGTTGTGTSPPVRPPRPGSGPRANGNTPRRRPRAGGPGSGAGGGKRRPPKKKR